MEDLRQLHLITPVSEELWQAWKRAERRSFEGLVDIQSGLVVPAGVFVVSYWREVFIGGPGSKFGDVSHHVEIVLTEVHQRLEPVPRGDARQK